MKPPEQMWMVMSLGIQGPYSEEGIRNGVEAGFLAVDDLVMSEASYRAGSAEWAMLWYFDCLLPQSIINSRNSNRH
jgi:hypothetical protein